MGWQILLLQVRILPSCLCMIVVTRLRSDMRVAYPHVISSASCKKFASSQALRLDVMTTVGCRAAVYHHNTQQIEVVEVTDPYSRSLAADGARSQFVDLDNDTQLMPDGWQSHKVPALAGAKCRGNMPGHVVMCMLSSHQMSTKHRPESV